MEIMGTAENIDQKKIASKQENMTKISCDQFLLATLSINKILKS